MFEKYVKVTLFEKIDKDLGYFAIQDENMAKRTRPGQFFMISVSPKGVQSPYLVKRPLSVFSVSLETSEIFFYYKIQGEGLGFFHRSIQVGDEIDVVGPLGRGFQLNQEGKHIVLVGGGLGIPPVFFLYEALRSKNTCHMILGAREERFLRVLDHYSFSPEEVAFYTDDGSYGSKGSIIDGLKNYAESHPVDFIAVCGPSIVLEKVGLYSLEKNIPCEVSVEERMVCGIRACMACSVNTSRGKQRTCGDVHGGPVFSASLLYSLGTGEYIGV